MQFRFQIALHIIPHTETFQMKVIAIFINQVLIVLKYHSIFLQIQIILNLAILLPLFVHLSDQIVPAFPLIWAKTRIRASLTHGIAGGSVLEEL